MVSRVEHLEQKYNDVVPADCIRYELDGVSEEVLEAGPGEKPVEHHRAFNCERDLLAVDFSRQIADTFVRSYPLSLGPRALQSIINCGPDDGAWRHDVSEVVKRLQER